MRLRVNFYGDFLWYNAGQISVGDDDSGVRAVLESADGPVAQLDRASDFGSEGWGFDSLRGRHSKRRICHPAHVPATFQTISTSTLVTCQQSYFEVQWHLRSELWDVFLGFWARS